MKVCDLDGVFLNWAVAKAEGLELVFDRSLRVDGGLLLLHPKELDCRGERTVLYQPSSNWLQGGQIIDREGIRVGPDQYTEHAIKAFDNKVKTWKATCYWITPEGNGPTALIAAMRCYVACRLGDEINVPDVLSETVATPMAA